MKRFACGERVGWEKRAEERGLIFHTPKVDDAPARYWNEGTYYAFTMTEVEVIEAATAEVHRLCLGAVDHIIKNQRYAVIGSWVVGDEPAGMVIRESHGPITDNLAVFTPHLIREDA